MGYVEIFFKAIKGRINSMLALDKLAPNGKVSIFEVISVGWSLFLKNIGSISLLTLLLSLGKIFLERPFMVSDDLSLLYFIGMLINLFVVLPVTTGPIIILSAATINDEPISLTEAFKISLQKIPSSAVTTLIFSVFILVLCLLLIIPGIIGLVYYFLFYQVIFLRNYRGFDALRYSKRLVSGFWWHAFAIIIVTTIPAIGFSIFALDLIDWIINLSLITLSFLDIFLRCFAGGFGTCVSVVLFLTLEKLKEEPVAAEAIPAPATPPPLPETVNPEQ